VLRTLKSVLKHWQAAQKTERKSESESEIAMCDRMQMYNIMSRCVYKIECATLQILLHNFNMINLNKSQYFHSKKLPFTHTSVRVIFLTTASHSRTYMKSTDHIHTHTWGCSQARAVQSGIMMLFWALQHHSDTFFEDSDMKHKILTACLVSDLRCLFYVCVTRELSFHFALKGAELLRGTGNTSYHNLFPFLLIQNCVPDCPGTFILRTTTLIQSLWKIMTLANDDTKYKCFSFPFQWNDIFCKFI
jgi:hypothetical protein